MADAAEKPKGFMGSFKAISEGAAKHGYQPVDHEKLAEALAPEPLKATAGALVRGYKALQEKKASSPQLVVEADIAVKPMITPTGIATGEKKIAKV